MMFYFFKKKFFSQIVILSVFLFSISSNADDVPGVGLVGLGDFKSNSNGATNNEPPETPTGEKAEAPAPVCDETMQEQVVASVSEDANDMVLAETTMNVAKEALGESAKIAYELSGGMNAGIAVYATNKWIKCKTLIATCETQCNEEITALKDQGHLNPNPKIGDLEKILSACTASSTACEAIGAQAVMNGGAAALDFLVASKLGNGEGDDDGNEGKLEKEDTLSGIKMGAAAGGLGDFSGSSSLGGGPQDSSASYAEVDTNILSTEDTRKSSKQNPANSNPPIQSAAYPMSRRNDLESNPDAISGTGAYSPQASSLKEEDSEGKTGRKPTSRSSLRGSSSFAGGQTQQDSSARGGGRAYRYGLNRSKVADLNKGIVKNQLKRNIFAKSNIHDNIFLKASKLIKNYCSEGAKECH